MRTFTIVAMVFQALVVLSWISGIVLAWISNGWIYQQLFYALAAGYGGSVAVAALIANRRRLRSVRIATISGLLTGETEDDSWPSYRKTYLTAFIHGWHWSLIRRKEAVTNVELQEAYSAASARVDETILKG